MSLFPQALGFLHAVLFSVLVGSDADGLPRRHRERCFQEPPIGCFSTKYPYNNTRRLPHSPSFIDIHYKHLIHNDSARFHWQDADVFMKARFRPELDTKIVVHGFVEFGDKWWVTRMVSEITKLSEPVNVVVLDWRRGARVLSMAQAIANGRVVAAMGALFLNHLVALGASPGSFHVIGNSLGAHIAGDLASRVPGTGRVTGMDPSRQWRMGLPPEVKLDPTDAVTVDVIHTDGAGLLSYGSLTPTGSVDFYANGGVHQPGCRDTLWDVFADLFLIGKEKCSHSRAIKLFTESISTCSILATPCTSVDEITNGKCADQCAEGGNSCVRFGYHLDSNVRGLYAFNTSGESPFCL